MRRASKSHCVIRRADLSLASRTFWAIALGLLLVMRLLTPTGFMPTWSGHELRIVICNDAGAQVGAASDHEHGKKDEPKLRHSCPYAAASAESFLWSPTPDADQLRVAAAMAHNGAAPADWPPKRKIERPPSRAPPVPA